MVGGQRVFEKWLAVFVVVVVAFETTLAQRGADLYEGNNCVLQANRNPGTCRLLTDCPKQLQLLRARRRFQPQICSFQGSNPIVCCENDPVVIPSVAPPPNTPATVVTPKATLVGNRIMAGEKSKKACEEYSNEIPRQVIPLIHDGVPTTQGEFPHMALLGYMAQGQGEITWNCGGALISDRFVVTAAHCFGNKLLRAPVRVRLGEYDLTDNKDQAEDYGIERYILHPQYSSRSWYNDLALIKLNRKVKFSSYVHPACLWLKPEDPQTGLIVSGWGSTAMDGGAQSDILLKGKSTLTRVAPEVCTKFYRAAANRLREGIKSGMLCAVDPVGSVDTCEGDSGGPIQVTTGSQPGVGYYVIGVTSGGSSLCGGKTPAIYTRLNNYLEWIETNVWP